MATVVGKSRNPTLNMAWAAFKKEQRAGTKAAKEEAPAPVPAKKAAAKKATSGKGKRRA